MHTQKARAKVVGLWKLCERHGGHARVSGESSPLRGAATWAEELKSLREGERDFSPGEKERGTEREGGGRDSPPRGRARAFETRFSSPIHLFLSSTPIEKRCSRPALDVPKNGFLR